MDEAELPYPQLKVAQTLEFQIDEVLVRDLKEQDVNKQLFLKYPRLQEFHFLPFSLRL
jgi:hypothetical protein